MDYIDLIQKFIKEYALTSLLKLSGLKKWIAGKALKAAFKILDSVFDNWKDAIEHNKNEKIDTENEQALKEAIDQNLSVEERRRREKDLLNGL